MKFVLGGKDKQRSEELSTASAAMLLKTGGPADRYADPNNHRPICLYRALRASWLLHFLVTILFWMLALNPGSGILSLDSERGIAPKMRVGGVMEKVFFLLALDWPKAFDSINLDTQGEGGGSNLDSLLEAQRRFCLRMISDIMRCRRFFV